jgi:hypothetical protein
MSSFVGIYLALFFNQYVNPIGFDNLGWKYYIVVSRRVTVAHCIVSLWPMGTPLISQYVCILAAMLVAQYFLFPETKGRT